jgi:hypothetical protein
MVAGDYLFDERVTAMTPGSSGVLVSFARSAPAGSTW